jgi:hypothetical protein
MTENV